MIMAGDRVVVIEANPRASRTVPIVAKATGLDVVAAAVRCALGSTLAEVGLEAGLASDGLLVAVKAPVGSLWRLPGVSDALGPEMRSTGEVLGLAADAGDAMRLAEEAVAAACDRSAGRGPDGRQARGMKRGRRFQYGGSWNATAPRRLERESKRTGETAQGRVRPELPSATGLTWASD